MEAQYAEAKENLIAELKEKTTSITIKDFSPAGIRVDYNSEGEVTGMYNARHIETASGLVKPDGSSEYESPRNRYYQRRRHHTHHSEGKG